MQYKRIVSVLRWIAAALVVLLAIWKVVDLATASAQVGHWRDKEARDRYARSYADVLATLPAPSATLDVATSFGSVRVLRWDGPGGGTPALLVPGHSSGAPMWAENLPDWIGQRTIYAVDPMGDAGFSRQSVPMTSPVDQAQIIAEALDSLKLRRVHVIGHSFGGAVAAQFAVSYPDRVQSLALAEPVFVLHSLPPSLYLWSAVMVLPTPQSWKDRALAAIGGTTVAEVRKRTPLSVMINEAATGYSVAQPTPRLLDDDQWRSLKMPIRLDVGGDSKLAGGQQAADRMRSLQPDATVTVWPGGTHSLPMDERQTWDPLILTFWADSER